MTEAEWLTSEDPEALISLPPAQRTTRKCRHLGAAYCRLLWPLMVKDELLRRGLEAVEAELDLERDQNEPDAEELAFRRRLGLIEEREGAEGDPGLGEPWEELAAARRDRTIGATRFRRDAAQVLLAWDDPEMVAAILFDCFKSWGVSVGLFGQVANARREIFGNPFRPVTFSPDWRTSTVVARAQQMYESRDFGAVPVLATALQDAGCDSADVLDHCRGPGPHVRGCWVVDLVLGKT